MPQQLIRLGLILTMLGTASCATHDSQPVSSVTVSPLVGRIDMPARRTQALSSEVGNGATVSLIDPTSGNTVATSLSSATGAFAFKFANAFQPAATPYFLEAVKGLSVGGAPNRPGAPAVRLRTLIRYNGEWVSLTGYALVIDTSTTALCALSNLRSFSDAQNLALMGTLTVSRPSALGGITTPDTFAGTADLNDTDFHQTWDLVSKALAADSDPIAGLFLRPTSGATSSVATSSTSGLSANQGIAFGSDGWNVSSLTPLTAATGDIVTLYGQGFPTSTDSITVQIQGLTCPVTGVNGTGTSLTFTVPSGYTPMPSAVTVSIGVLQNSALSLTLL